MIDISSPVIDFHVHLYPPLPIPDKAKAIRKSIRTLLKPVSNYQNKIQTWFRKVPLGPRKIIHELAVPTILPHLILESNHEDLMEQTNQYNVLKTIVIPHPPLLSNDFVFYECRKSPDKLITSTFIDPQTLKTAEDLAMFYNRGVRIFKINPIQSGVPASAPYYDKFLEYLNNKQAIVILHTGSIYSKVYKTPEDAEVTSYNHWFARYPQIRFLLAHMNLHAPDKAINVAEKYSNVYLLTSWQSSEVILNAVKKVGAHKVLFASDWPMMGNNIALQKERIIDLYKKGLISEAEVNMIFYENAKSLLKEQGILN